jgi:hypothetical protein
MPAPPMPAPPMSVPPMSVFLLSVGYRPLLLASGQCRPVPLRSAGAALC